MHHHTITVPQKCHFDFLSSISDAAVPTIEDRAGAEVANYYFTEYGDLTLTCKITAADGEYTLAWFDNGMYNVIPILTN